MQSCGSKLYLEALIPLISLFRTPEDIFHELALASPHEIVYRITCVAKSLDTLGSLNQPDDFVISQLSSNK